MEKISVLFVNGNSSACNFYRISQPARKLIENDTFVCAMSQYLNAEELEMWIDRADVFFSQKTSDKFVKFMYEEREKKKFIIDQDDDNFSVSPYNPGYRDFGIKPVTYFLADGSEIKLKDKTEIDGRVFDIEANKKKLQCLRTSLTLAHRITTPSPVLSGKFKKINKNTCVIPNLLDFRNWEPINLVKDEWVRIGYQCGWSHFEDFWEVQEALRIIMEKYPNVRLVIMGQAYDKQMENYPQDRIDKIGWVDIETYPWRIKSLNLDIGIAPLRNMEFNNCKSVLKWSEYSALKIPCVASDCVPYNLRIIEGDTGFLCKNTSEWVNVLSNLIEEKEMRVRIGNQAYEHVKQTYDLEKEIVHYETLIKNVVDDKVIA